jgi:hypothetical protein
MVAASHAVAGTWQLPFSECRCHALQVSAAAGKEWLALQQKKTTTKLTSPTGRRLSLCSGSSER